MVLAAGDIFYKSMVCNVGDSTAPQVTNFSKSKQ